MLKENERFKLTQVVEREPKMSDYEKFVVDVAKRLGQSLEYLHQLGIVVRDFDYSNVVMTQIDVVWPQIVNVHNFVCIGPDQLTEENYGDSRFRAPEVLLGEPYNTKSDVWTFGVLIYYMLTFELPFKGDKESMDFSVLKTSMDNVKEILGKANLSETATDLLSRVLM